ncbi:efflux transporter periplasmic adaptor subunit [Marinobacter lutaoensis]|uniref:Efflux transporter periplasmic adaptor subunit n=1 Tax=Marinobacter lutaoensis TaxID=135739 RepID=A0A1V2DSC3_9GAMM|nr:efflux RND transporter periplasmic adaptor subunit [Marinobacter lutaoensis]ONF43201.1 efflux transporter periplasmic adaptor subunit [Marinobacter lutaoensis]
MTTLRIFVVPLLATSLALAGCKTGEVDAGSQAPAVSVRVAEVTAADTQGVPLRFSGIVRASQRATLTFQVSGTLKARAVELGQGVAAGEVLARVYNPALEPARDSARARLDELTAQYEQAGREWERASRLHQRGVVSEQNLEQIAARRDALKASVATAEAALAEASRRLEESALRAPFAGRVEALLVEKGEFVAAGQPVMRLSSPAGQEVEIRVPAYLLEQIRLGQSVPVWPVQDRSLPPVTGAVVEIAQASAIRGELHPVLVRLPEAALSSGQPVEVGIRPRYRGALTVPLLAVVRDVDGTRVFRVRGRRAERVPVAVERVVGERVVVRSETLQAGDRVVYAGMTRLVDGDAVEVR